MRLARVGNDTDRALQKALRKLGPLVVNEALLRVLADTYGVEVQHLHEAAAMSDAGHETLSGDQPELDGDLDLVLLRSECDEALSERTAGANVASAEAFAVVGDPRLPRQRSLVSVVPGGLVWAAMVRPHQINEFQFADIRLIWHPGGWQFEFIDWRRRAFAPIKSSSWDHLMVAVRDE